MSRDQHLIRFGAFAYSAITARRRLKLAPPAQRHGLRLLARADAQSARHHWQQAHLPSTPLS